MDLRRRLFFRFFQRKQSWLTFAPPPLTRCFRLWFLALEMGPFAWLLFPLHKLFCTLTPLFFPFSSPCSFSWCLSSSSFLRARPFLEPLFFLFPASPSTIRVRFSFVGTISHSGFPVLPLPSLLTPLPLILSLSRFVCTPSRSSSLRAFAWSSMPPLLVLSVLSRPA